MIHDKNSSSKWLILPMEIIERELAGSLLLVAEASSRGWQSIIGTRHTITPLIENLPKGVVLVKSLLKSDEENLNIYKNAGNKIVSQDIEGLVYRTIEEMVDVRFDPSTVPLAEKVFFWGETQTQALKKAFPDHASKFKATGSPTADIWRRTELHQIYKDQVNELKDKYGPYIILPSAFGSVNHFMGKKSTLQIILDDNNISDAKREKFAAYWSRFEDHVEKIFHNMLNLIPDVSQKFPDHTIIIRPHPSESHEAWLKAAEHCENVKVIFEGPVTPWLLGAEAVFHWGCSTGVESHLLGRPVISYDTIKSEGENFNNDLPDTVSIKADTKEKFFHDLENILKEPEKRFENYPELRAANEKLSRWVLMGDDDKSEVNILNELDTIDLMQQEFRNLPAPKRNYKEIIWQIIELFDKALPILKFIYPNKIKKGLSSRSYGRHKMRSIHEDRVTSILNRICSVKDINNLNVRKLQKNLFLISSK